MPIDQNYALGWMEESIRQAGLGSATEFVDGAMRRLEKGAREYGPDGYRRRGLPAVLAEAGEEGLDTAAWAVLASDLIVPHQVGAQRADYARRLLLNASSAGVASWDLFRQVGEVLGH